MSNKLSKSETLGVFILFWLEVNEFAIFNAAIDCGCNKTATT